MLETMTPIQKAHFDNINWGGCFHEELHATLTRMATSTTAAITSQSILCIGKSVAKFLINSIISLKLKVISHT